MTVFYLTLVITFIFALVARLNSNISRKGRPELLLSIILISIITVVAGLRYNIGDTGSYIHLYELIAQEPSMGLAVENYKDSYEFGFVALFWLLSVISKDYQFMIFIFALITNVLNLWTMRIYSKVFELEIYMYITSGYYLVTMNGIRQCLVAAILFAATKYIIDGNFIKYCVVVIIMSTIHTTSLVMIPIYFIVRCEAWSKNTMKIIVIASIALICFQPLMDAFFEAAEGTKYEAYEETMESEEGANPIRTVITAVPVVLSYIFREKLKKDWPESNIFINMTLICLIITVFSMINWVFNRFNLYFQIYSFILLPYIIKNCFTKRQKSFIYLGFLACYFIFFYYEHVITLNVVYKSHYINLF